jgi:hypothetical protein
MIHCYLCLQNMMTFQCSYKSVLWSSLTAVAYRYNCPVLQSFKHVLSSQTQVHLNDRALQPQNITYQSIRYAKYIPVCFSSIRSASFIYKLLPIGSVTRCRSYFPRMVLTSETQSIEIHQHNTPYV